MSRSDLALRLERSLLVGFPYLPGFALRPFGQFARGEFRGLALVFGSARFGAFGGALFAFDRHGEARSPLLGDSRIVGSCAEARQRGGLGRGGAAQTVA